MKLEDVTPLHRLQHRRDQRFARIRTLTRSVVVGSSALSVALVGVIANNVKHYVHVAPTTTTTPSTPTGSTGSSGSTGVTPTTVYTTPTTAPVTTTTYCYTTPSGNQNCV